MAFKEALALEELSRNVDIEMVFVILLKHH